jgi:hypothetical protein
MGEAFNKETLANFWNKFENDNKHKVHNSGEITLLFVNIFGRLNLFDCFGDYCYQCMHYLVLLYLS